MASNSTASLISGYDFDFLTDPSDSLVCQICTFVACSPYQMNCCGRVYCQLCLVEQKKHSDVCPNCRQKGDSFLDKRSDNEIKLLKIKCTHNGDGCEWQGSLSCLDNHLKSCGYETVECSNQCLDDGNKVVTVLRKYLAEHLDEKCPRRTFECPHCQEKGEYQNMVGSHLDTCPNVAVDCPNEGCHKRFPRISTSSHTEVCDYQPLRCKYANVGCEKTVLRKDLEKHEEDAEYHLRVTTESVLSMKQHLMKLETKIDEASHKQSTDSYTFKVRPFAQLKKNKHSFVTSAYYLKGYKLSFKVKVNETAHIQMYVYLKKGKFDDQLSWPFNIPIAIELLNQLEDKNHYRRTLVFPDDGKPGHRVVDENSPGSGFGYPEFISEADLNLKSDTNCQYLKDDCLVFRISADKPSDKPWLDNNSFVQ